MFSMHSHSGQFCPGHAKDQLEEVVQRAIELKMPIFGMTEHMPRIDSRDLYPEEIELNHTIAELVPRHEAYLREAVRLRDKYKSQIKLLIGFEGEWIRPAYAPFVRSLAAHPDVDYFIGSVHHTHEIPIDYDVATYQRARDVSGSDEKLFEAYFDEQYEMLQALRPRVVGHFDLIRLLSDHRDADFKEMPGVWERVCRNLKKVKEIDGLLEINASALRKGLKEPYPTTSICLEFVALGGRFTLSDDSHGIPQVGLNVQRAAQYLYDLGVRGVSTLDRVDGEVKIIDLSLEEVLKNSANHR